MNDLRTSGLIRAETEPSLQAELTRIRSMIRRAPEGVEKQQLELLAAQLENGAPAAMIQRQLEVMAASQIQH